MHYYIGIMTKRIILFLNVFIAITICGSTFSQIRLSFSYYETHIFKADSTYKVFYVYKIPYNHFVFIKDGNKYTANFRLSIEVTDTVSNHVTRQIEDKIIASENYDETNSDNNYFDGITKFNLSTGKYFLHPMITDLNSNRDLKLPEVRIDLISTKGKDFYRPLVVDNGLMKCDNKLLYQLTNFNDCVPFSENEFNLIIPCKDTSISQIYVRLLNNKDTVYSGNISESFISGILPEECEDRIALDSSKEIIPTRNFILKNFSHKLKEGNLRIYIFKDKKLVDEHPFVLDVTWFKKPFSLRDSKEAIKLLKYIDKESVIDSLLKFDSDDYHDVLFNYWKKYDPATSTEFNPLMNEYYQRIDYSIKTFSTLSGKSGAATDRGMTYIKLGKPKSVERSSNKYGKVVEKWIYENPLRVFEFIDQNGTGDYVLKK